MEESEDGVRRSRGNSAAAPDPADRRGRGTLVALILLFAAPVLGAYLWWSFPGLRPAGRTNHGDLIQPARPLQIAGLQTLDATPFGSERLKSKWTLVYFGRGPCESACRTNLYNMRQLRAALGKNTDRVQTLYVTAEANDRHLEAVQGEHPETVVVTGSGSALDALVSQFATEGVGPLSGEQRLYLVDPLGNLMMMFPDSLDPTKILKDLKRLLRVSQVG